MPEMVAGEETSPAGDGEDNESSPKANPVPNGYDESDRKAYDTQQEVADAWGDMKSSESDDSQYGGADGSPPQWPAHNTYTWGDVEGYGSPVPREVRNRMAPQAGNAYRVAELYSSENFRGYQLSDGTGVLMHYDTREAIRTRHGLTLSNEECWSTGLAHCSTPSDTDVSVPLDAIESYIDRQDCGDFDAYDICNVETHTWEEESRFGNVRTRAGDCIVTLENSQDERLFLALSTDPSALNGDGNMVWQVTTEEFTEYGPERISETLLPKEVRRSDMEVVDAREYTKTRLTEEERDAHIRAGGNVGQSQSRWRDDPVNHQQYRADLRGNVIVRHGEWFFIPQDADFEPTETGHAYASATLDSHRAKRHHGARSPLPTQCGECGDSSFYFNTVEQRFGSDYEAVECSECGAVVPRDIYVHGQIIHADGDHNAVHLGDTWHKAVTHDRDVLTYSTGAPGGRTGGWD